MINKSQGYRAANIIAGAGSNEGRVQDLSSRVDLEPLIRQLLNCCLAIHKNSQFLMEEDILHSEEIAEIGRSNIQVREALSMLEAQALEAISSVSSSKQAVNGLSVRISGLERQIVSLSERTQGLSQVFNEKIAHSASEAKAVDAITEELQGYKRAEFLSRIRPSVLATIAAYDLICDLLSNAQGSTSEDGLRAIKNQVLQSLLIQGVERFEQCGGHFDPRMQEVIEIRNTASRDEHEAVLAVHRAGFAAQGVVIRPQMVVVGKYFQKEEDNVQ